MGAIGMAMSSAGEGFIGRRIGADLGGARSSGEGLDGNPWRKDEGDEEARHACE